MSHRWSITMAVLAISLSSALPGVADDPAPASKARDSTLDMIHFNAPPYPKAEIGPNDLRYTDRFMPIGELRCQIDVEVWPPPKDGKFDFRSVFNKVMAHATGSARRFIKVGPVEEATNPQGYPMLAQYVVTGQPVSGPNGTESDHATPIQVAAVNLGDHIASFRIIGIDQDTFNRALPLYKEMLESVVIADGGPMPLIKPKKVDLKAAGGPKPALAPRRAATTRAAND
jgi:hypothetical protein